MGWLIPFGVLFLLAVLPLGVRVNYDSDGPRVKVILGPVKFTVYPLPKKEKKKKEPAKKQEKKEETQEENLPKPPQPPKQEKPKEKKKGGSLTDFIPFVKLIFNFLGDFRRKLRLDNLYLRLVLASSDPCDLAVNYGKTWAAVGNLLPALEKWFVIKKREIDVECDFTASETLVIAHADLTITLGRLLSLVIVYAVRALTEYLKLKKKRKGGAVT